MSELSPRSSPPPAGDREPPSRQRRRRRNRDSVELALFSYVRSQCTLEAHVQQAEQGFCLTRNCHFYNLECLERLLRSARKSICVAMYQFSVRSLCDAIVYAKEHYNVAVRIIGDNKMRRNQGTTFTDMVNHGEWSGTGVKGIAM